MPKAGRIRRLGISSAIAAAALLAGAAPATAASSCAAEGVSVTPLQSDTFYIDSASGVRYLGSYVGYRLENTGTVVRDGLWQRLESFSGGVVAPASGRPVAETLPVERLAPGARTSLYSYLRAPAATTVVQQHDVVVYTGRPGAGGAELCRETQTIARVSDVIKAAANKVETATTSTSSVSLGGTFDLTVTGDAGTIGDGPATDLGVIRFSPAVADDWPSEAFRLVSVSHQIPTGAAAVTDLLSRGGMTGSPKYTVSYRFRAVGPTTAPTPVVPVQNIASGTQVKHTDPGTLGSLQPIPVVTSSTTVSIAAGPGPHAPGATVPLTVTVRNSGSGDVSLDDLVVRLPGGWTYRSGSAQRDGVAIADPHETTATELHLVGPHTVRGGSQSVFELDVAAGAAGTTGDASAVATLAGGQLDATLDANDDSPARATLSVLGAPAAADDSVVVPTGQTSGIDVLGNDSIAGGRPAITITRPPAHGIAVVAGGGVRYTPDAGHQGADSFDYRLTTEAGSSDARVSINVDAAAAPAPVALTSTGVGTAPQQQTVNVPLGGTVDLLDAGQGPVTTVSVPAGTYRLDRSSATIRFEPAVGFVGVAPPVTYRVSNGGGASGTATYTPTVTLPSAPAPGAAGSTGTGAQTQDSQLPIPSGGSVTLLDRNGLPATLVDVPGEGTYALDVSTGQVTFVPAPGFSGQAGGVVFRTTDAYGQAGSARYTPVVVLPPAPAAGDLSTTGTEGASQATHLVVPAGASIRLLSGGVPVTRVTVPGEGVYTLDPSTGLITFTPAGGFTGSAGGVTYRITDSYGQSVSARYVPTVTAVPAPAVQPDRPASPAPAVPAAPARALRTAKVVPPAETEAAVTRSEGVPVTCRSNLPIARCDIRLTARVSRRVADVGHGWATADGKRSVTVDVKLNRLGRALTRQVGGARLRIAGVVRSRDGGLVAVSGRTRVVASRVLVPRPVFFDTDSATVRPSDLRYLEGLRGRLAGVRAVSCVGFTDSRNSDAYNEDLGLARARAVCAVLRRGRERFETVRVSRGEDAPHAPNTTAHGMQLNRRTEITLKY